MKSSSRIEPRTAGHPSALRRALRVRPSEWLDLSTAAAELLLARVRLATWGAERLISGRPPAYSSGAARETEAERVRLAIARAAHRVPWRSDCLVQALAAQRWLRRLGVQAELIIGVPETQPRPFEAHAWLMSGDRVITGGDVSRYLPLLRQAARHDAPD